MGFETDFDAVQKRSFNANSIEGLGQSYDKQEQERREVPAGQDPQVIHSLTGAELRQLDVNSYLKKIKALRQDIEHHDELFPPFFRLFFETFENLKPQLPNEFYIGILSSYIFILDLHIHEISDRSELYENLHCVQNITWDLFHDLLSSDNMGEENPDADCLDELSHEREKIEELIRMFEHIEYEHFLKIDSQFATLGKLYRSLHGSTKKYKDNRSLLIQCILELINSLMLDAIRDSSLIEPKPLPIMLSDHSGTASKDAQTILKIYCDYVKTLVDEGPNSPDLAVVRKAVLNHPDYYKISERSKYALLKCVAAGLVVGALISTVVVLLACANPHVAKLMHDSLGAVISTIATTTAVGGFLGWGWSVSRVPLSLDIKTAEFNRVEEKARLLWVD